METLDLAVLDHVFTLTWKTKTDVMVAFLGPKKPVGNFSQIGGLRRGKGSKLGWKRRKHSFRFPGRTAGRIALECGSFEQGLE